MPKNIVIIGDSWSIGESLGYVEGYAPLEYELMTSDTRVFARGHGGSNNLYELRQFEYFLRNTVDKFKIDHVIWFHTELMRDRLPFDVKDLDSYIDKIAEATYSTASSIHKKYPYIKWIIIGGHEPIVRHKELLSFASVLIEDWRSEILGVKMPYTNFLGHLDYLEKHIETIGIDRIEQELSKRATILAAGNNCKEFFYDDIHPNSKAFNMLAQRLKSYLGV